MKNAVSIRTRTNLVALYEELESMLRTLDSLGYTKEKYDNIFTPLVELRLPEGTLIVWEKQRSVKDFGKRSLEKQMTFLQKTVQDQKVVVLARTRFGATQKKNSCEKKRNFHSFRPCKHNK